MVLEPSEPPTTNITFVSALNPKSARLGAMLGATISRRKGLPVCATRPGGNDAAACGNERAMRYANFPAHLLTRPGTVSDSWRITGILQKRAARSAGKLPKPP